MPDSHSRLIVQSYIDHSVQPALIAIDHTWLKVLLCGLRLSRKVEFSVNNLEKPFGCPDLSGLKREAGERPARSRHCNW
jgi:hypothetical protein